MILNLSNKIQSDIEYDSSTFPGGECHIRLKGEVLSPITIRTRLNSSYDIMQLLIATDAVRRGGVEEIHLQIPYLPYSQQDRVCNPGESHSLKVIGDLINSLRFKSVTILDPHSNVCEAVLNNLIIIKNDIFIKWVLEELKLTKLNIIVPDEGASKKIYGLSPIFTRVGVEVNLVICSKLRDMKTSKIIKTVVPKIENDWDNLIIDDICLAGGTFVNIINEIRAQKGLVVNHHDYLAVSHGVFNEGFEKLKNYFTKIFCTNSVRDISPNGFVEQYKL